MHARKRERRAGKERRVSSESRSALRAVRTLAWTWRQSLIVGSACHGNANPLDEHSPSHGPIGVCVEYADDLRHSARRLVLAAAATDRGMPRLRSGKLQRLIDRQICVTENGDPSEWMALSVSGRHTASPEDLDLLESVGHSFLFERQPGDPRVHAARQAIEGSGSSHGSWD